MVYFDLVIRRVRELAELFGGWPEIFFFHFFVFFNHFSIPSERRGGRAETLFIPNGGCKG